MSQDFSITNPVAPTPRPAFPGRPNLMRQLQAWWDVHAYYPKHASNNDEGGIVKIHLNILPDGRVWAVKVVESSGSQSIDGAAVAVFKGAFVTPAPSGTPEADPEVSLHYVLAPRHDQPVPAGYMPVPSTRPFTIANDPVKSPILETMLQRTCTGTVVKKGIRNHPMYGGCHFVQADTQYAAWPNGENKFIGNLETVLLGYAGAQQDGLNHGGTIDFTCATETVPAINYNSSFVQNVVVPPGDPP